MLANKAQWAKMPSGKKHSVARVARHSQDDGECVKRQQEPGGEDAKLDKDCKREVDREADSREQTGGAEEGDHKGVAQGLRTSRTWVRISGSAGELAWQKELAQIEHRKNDLLPEREYTQKRPPEIAESGGPCWHRAGKSGRVSDRSEQARFEIEKAARRNERQWAED